MNKKECKQKLGLDTSEKHILVLSHVDIGLDEKAIEQSNKFSRDKTEEETIEIFKNLYSIIVKHLT